MNPLKLYLSILPFDPRRGWKAADRMVGIEEQVYEEISSSCAAIVSQRDPGSKFAQQTASLPRSMERDKDLGRWCGEELPPESFLQGTNRQSCSLFSFRLYAFSFRLSYLPPPGLSPCLLPIFSTLFAHLFSVQLKFFYHFFLCFSSTGFSTTAIDVCLRHWIIDKTWETFFHLLIFFGLYLFILVVYLLIYLFIYLFI